MTRRYLTPAEKAALIDQQDGLCAICGKRLEGPSECDHSTPHAWRPERKPNQIVCVPCHRAKSARDVAAIAKVKRIRRKQEPEYICTNGHDRCYGGASAGPECPYCERRPVRRKAKIPSRPFSRTHRRKVNGTTELRT